VAELLQLASEEAQFRLAKEQLIADIHKRRCPLCGMRHDWQDGDAWIKEPEAA
jgi:hypothetical protein